MTDNQDHESGAGAADDLEPRGLSIALADVLHGNAGKIERVAYECTVERPDWAAAGENPPTDET